MALPDGKGKIPKLSPDEQSAVLLHLSYSLLRQSTVITALLYSFAALIVLYEHREYTFGFIWLLLFLFFGFGLIVWVFRNDVAYFSAKSWFRLSRAEWAQIWFCCYELSLATLSVTMYLQYLRTHHG
jgi:hypothetical protein